MLMMTFFSLVILGATGFVVAWLLRVFGPKHPPTNDALAILDQRFARGEINQEEYDTRRQVLVRR